MKVGYQHAFKPFDYIWFCDLKLWLLKLMI